MVSSGNHAKARSLREEGLAGRRRRVIDDASWRRGPDVGEVVDHHVGERGLLVRQYTGPDQSPVAPDAPTYLMVHGGGGIFGSVASYDAMSRQLCASTGSQVFAVEYRLAPETPLPGAVEDATTAYLWLVQQLFSESPQRRIALLGDSMGGLIAVLVARNLVRSAVRRPPLALCLLYPNTDLTLAYVRQEADVPAIPYHKDDMEQIVPLLGLGPDPTPWSPLHSCVMATLPPTFMITAQHDILRAEGLEFARQLSAAGVRVVSGSAPGMAHGFFNAAQPTVAITSECRRWSYLMQQFCWALEPGDSASGPFNGGDWSLGDVRNDERNSEGSAGVDKHGQTEASGAVGRPLAEGQG